MVSTTYAMSSGELRLEMVKKKLNDNNQPPTWNSWDVFTSNIGPEDAEIVDNSINEYGICAPTLPATPPHTPPPPQTPPVTPPCYLKPPVKPPITILQKTPHLGVDAWHGQFWYTEIYLPKWPSVFCS